MVSDANNSVKRDERPKDFTLNENKINNWLISFIAAQNFNLSSILFLSNGNN